MFMIHSLIDYCNNNDNNTNTTTTTTTTTNNNNNNNRQLCFDITTISFFTLNLFYNSFWAA